MAKKTDEADVALAALAGLTATSEPDVQRRIVNVYQALAAAVRARGLDPTQLTREAQFEVLESREGHRRTARGSGRLYVAVGAQGSRSWEAPRTRFHETRAGVDVEAISWRIFEAQKIGLRVQSELEARAERRSRAKALSGELQLAIEARGHSFTLVNLSEDEVVAAAAAIHRWRKQST